MNFGWKNGLSCSLTSFKQLRDHFRRLPFHGLHGPELSVREIKHACANCYSAIGHQISLFFLPER